MYMDVSLSSHQSRIAILVDMHEYVWTEKRLRTYRCVAQLRHERVFDCTLTAWKGRPLEFFFEKVSSKRSSAESPTTVQENDDGSLRSIKSFDSDLTYFALEAAKEDSRWTAVKLIIVLADTSFQINFWPLHEKQFCLYISYLRNNREHEDQLWASWGHGQRRQASERAFQNNYTW